MNLAVDVEAINLALRGVSQLLAFELQCIAGEFGLTLTLGRGGKLILTVLCKDVQNLELNPTGDGFDLLRQLKVVDMRSDGLERIRFSIEELEQETLFLHCADIQLVRPI